MGKREKGVREGSYGVGSEIRIRDKALSWSRVFEFLDEARTADRAGKISGRRGSDGYCSVALVAEIQFRTAVCDVDSGGGHSYRLLDWEICWIK